MINKTIAKMIPLLPERFVWVFSKKYIAGKTLEEGLNVVKVLNDAGMVATLDILGESVTKHDEAIIFRQQYFDAINAVAEQQRETSFSLKPSMFGLEQNPHDCFILVRDIVKTAGDHHFTVTIDMEDSSHTDAELDLFLKLYREFPASVGIVLQACLKRTFLDIQHLLKEMDPNYPINVRLCKGIYIEPVEIAYTDKDQINSNYTRCLDYMMMNKFYPAIATHDKTLVKQARERIKKYALRPDAYEFQMLYGVTPGLRNKIVKEGHHMRVYVPFGMHWFRYSTRRLKENPHLIKDIILAFFKKG